MSYLTCLNLLKILSSSDNCLDIECHSELFKLCPEGWDAYAVEQVVNNVCFLFASVAHFIFDTVSNSCSIKIHTQSSPVNVAVNHYNVPCIKAVWSSFKPFFKKHYIHYKYHIGTIHAHSRTSMAVRSLFLQKINLLLDKFNFTLAIL